jgi:hypothetical protein
MKLKRDKRGISLFFEVSSRATAKIYKQSSGTVPVSLKEGIGEKHLLRRPTPGCLRRKRRFDIFWLLLK